MSQDNLIGLQCIKCKNVTHITVRNKKRVPEKLKPKKYCKWCRLSTEHKEVKA